MSLHPPRIRFRQTGCNTPFFHLPYNVSKATHTWPCIKNTTPLHLSSSLSFPFVTHPGFRMGGPCPPVDPRLPRPLFPTFQTFFPLFLGPHSGRFLNGMNMSPFPSILQDVRLLLHCYQSFRTWLAIPAVGRPTCSSLTRRRVHKPQRGLPPLPEDSISTSKTNDLIFEDFVPPDRRWWTFYVPVSQKNPHPTKTTQPPPQTPNPKKTPPFPVWKGTCFFSLLLPFFSPAALFLFFFFRS